MRLRDAPGLDGVLVLDPDPALLPQRTLAEAMGELRALVSLRTQVRPLTPACATGSGPWDCRHVQRRHKTQPGVARAALVARLFRKRKTRTPKISRPSAGPCMVTVPVPTRTPPLLMVGLD